MAQYKDQKRSDLRTDPRGTPYSNDREEDRLSRTLTLKVRSDTNEVSQFKTVPLMPNQEESRSRRILWSIVSKAADKSSMHKPVKRLLLMALTISL